MAAKIPGAVNVPAAGLTSDMLVALGLVNPEVGQTTLGALAQFLPGLGLPVSKLVTGVAAVALAGDITGADFVNYQNNASNATYTLRTAAQMFGDIPNAKVGYSYQLAIRNLNATGLTVTAPDASVTLSGTMTIPQNATRMFNVTFTAAGAVTITSMGSTGAVA